MHGHLNVDLLLVCFSTPCAKNHFSQSVLIDQSREGVETFGAHTRACCILIKGSSQHLARTVRSCKVCFIVLLESCLHEFFKLLDPSYIFNAFICLGNQTRTVLITGKVLCFLVKKMEMGQNFFREFCLSHVNKIPRTPYTFLHLPPMVYILTLATDSIFNPLTPNDHYSGRTAPLSSTRFILYIY